MEECPICLKNIECESVCDTCSLKTCKECIGSWRRKKPSCPQCRHGSKLNTPALDSDEYDDHSLYNLLYINRIREQGGIYSHALIDIDIGGQEIDRQYGEWLEILENQNPE